MGLNLTKEILQETLYKRDSEMFYQAQVKKNNSNTWHNVISMSLPLVSKDDAIYYMFREFKTQTKVTLLGLLNLVGI
jgi:hypothetical protein